MCEFFGDGTKKKKKTRNARCDNGVSSSGDSGGDNNGNKQGKCEYEYELRYMHFILCYFTTRKVGLTLVERSVDCCSI